MISYEHQLKGTNMSNTRLDTFHVVYNKNRGGWGVKRGGNNSASSRHKTKDATVAAARDLARRHHGELIVHNMNGRIAYRNSYGNDPHPPKG